MTATVTPINLLSALDLWDSLNPGDQVLVRFGSRGSQAAVIVRRTRDGNLLVRKYRAKSRSYTKPVRLHPGEVLNVIKRSTQ